MDTSEATSGELTIAQLRERRNAKWTFYSGDVIPCWIAEMDFAVAGPIQTALEHMVGQQDYGYPLRDGAAANLSLGRAFARRMRARYDWEVAAEDVTAATNLVQASFASVLAFSEPGDGVVVQTPCYPPFREAVLTTGRRLVEDPLEDDGTRYVMKLIGLDGRINPTTRVMLFCNPHNPTGRAFSREELEAVGRLAVAHDLVIVSDEIHADLVYPGQRHIPLSSVSSEIAARTVTITSATKGFNISGLTCSIMHFGSPRLKARFHARVPHRLLGTPAIMGVDATVAAWDEGQPWMDRTLSKLASRRDQLLGRLADELPEARVHAPEATYLSWIDFSALHLPMPAGQFFLQRAGVAASPGENFDPAASHFLRLNFATSSEILDEILNRMVRAVRTNA